MPHENTGTLCSEPASDVPVDLLAFYTVVPFTISRMQPKLIVQALVRAWIGVGTLWCAAHRCRWSNLGHVRIQPSRPCANGVD